MFDNEYIEALNNAYWAEEAEMEVGVHPTQVQKRIEECLSEQGVVYDGITFLDWIAGETRVKVSLDNCFYGVFDYIQNCFI